LLIRQGLVVVLRHRKIVRQFLVGGKSLGVRKVPAERVLGLFEALFGEVEA
jgi:hypothetical protein